MMKGETMTYTISITEIVSFIYMSGDLSADNFQNVSQLEGIKAHQYLQKQFKSDDQKEVCIYYETNIDGISLRLQGRMDGLLSDQTILEIKSTKSGLDLLFVERLEHLAQLKFYAYMYMKNHDLTAIKGQLTYISLIDYDTKTFSYVFDVETLASFFDEAMMIYIKWLTLQQAHETKRHETIGHLAFPFETYRAGQRAFMKAIYHTVNEQGILYAIAPTGIGKTMASLFSTIKTLKEPNEKIFYLTAKNEGKKVAIEAVRLMHDKGLKVKMLELTSKDSICFLTERNCDPAICPFAKGFFDRLRDAIIDIYQHEDIMTRDIIEAYAQKHTVCPFEFSLSVSNYCDIILCDYNYVFDPRAHLIRYFDEANYQPILLIDEAHNLVSRSKEMFSSTLLKSELIDLRRAARTLKPSITHSINKLIHHFENYLHTGFQAYPSPSKDLMDLVNLNIKKLQKSFSITPNHPKKSLIMDGYFKLLQFENMFEYYNQAYRTNITVDDDVKITLQCLDASQFLKDIMTKKAFGTILFSATLYPLEYYSTLLSQKLGESIIIPQPFDKKRLKVMTYRLDTRYSKRKDSVETIIDTIQTVTTSKKGNYICFFPSYQYMDQVLSEVKEIKSVRYLIQNRITDIDSRKEILDQLRQEKPYSQVAFFVLGGMFSEGIDYVGDMLNGVIVVGVGLPNFNDETEQLRAYYQDTFDNGFHYAYTYPGMNKVIQAVGRVIRRQSDYGIAILLDDRFQNGVYQDLMPKAWKPYTIIKHQTDLSETLANFWQMYEK